LINAIIGQDRLITSNKPGTTRDSTDTFFKASAGNICFIDTAGIRKKSAVSRILEKLCVIMAIKSIRRSQVAALVLDATDAPSDQDLKIGSMIHDAGKSCIIVVNKWDLLGNDSLKQNTLLQNIRERFRFMDYAPILTTSAKNKKGLEQLLENAFHVWNNACLNIETPRLNKVLQSAVDKHRHPAVKGREVKFYYVTQQSVSPPTFLIFTNYPQNVTPSYLRYLQNCFRDALDFSGTPIRIFMRKRN
jgi:GTPase